MMLHLARDGARNVALEDLGRDSMGECQVRVVVAAFDKVGADYLGFSVPFLHHLGSRREQHAEYVRGDIEQNALISALIDQKGCPELHQGHGHAV